MTAAYVWRGDLKDDCYLEHDEFTCHLECMGSWWWFAIGSRTVRGWEFRAEEEGLGFTNGQSGGKSARMFVEWLITSGTAASMRDRYANRKGP